MVTLIHHNIIEDIKNGSLNYATQQAEPNTEFFQTQIPDEIEETGRSKVDKLLEDSQTKM
jgi:hypothetical protein